MGLKLSLLAAVAVVATPIAANAQSTAASSSQPAAGVQTDTQEGQTPAQKASKKSTAKPGAKAAPKAEVEVYSQEGLTPAQAASKKSARTKANADVKAGANATEA